MLVCVFLLCSLHTRPRVQRAPGLPCALCFRGGRNSSKPRAQRVARMRRCVSSLKIETESSSVVPANAGTHNHRPDLSCEVVVVLSFPTTRATEYGSLRSH